MDARVLTRSPRLRPSTSTSPLRASEFGLHPFPHRLPGLLQKRACSSNQLNRPLEAFPPSSAFGGSLALIISPQHFLRRDAPVTVHQIRSAPSRSGSSIPGQENRARSFCSAVVPRHHFVSQRENRSGVTTSAMTTCTQSRRFVPAVAGCRFVNDTPEAAGRSRNRCWSNRRATPRV